MASKITVLQIDDHPMIRSGFRMMFSATTDITMVSEADNVLTGIEEYKRWMPDVVIMDISMPEMNGLEGIKRLKAIDSDVKLLICSMYDNNLLIQQCTDAGALGYVTKTSSPDEIIEAIRVLNDGGYYYSSVIAQRLATQTLSKQKIIPSNLSEREFECFVLLAEGKDVAYISQKMKITESTVKTHNQNIKKKLSINNRAELTLLAVREGIIQP